MSQGALVLDRPQAAHDALPLWDYQREALDRFWAARARGVVRAVICFPTGGGKTVLAAHAVAEAGLPAVFICHRDELVKQTVAKFREFDPGISIAVCKAEQGRDWRELAGRDLVVASVQTLAREQRREQLVRAVGPGAFVIVDEAHHTAATSYQLALSALRPSLLLGLTATPKRGDGLALDTTFDEIVYSVPMRELVERGRLAAPIGVRVGTGVSLDGVHTRGGEFVDRELEMAVNTPQRNARVVDAWAEYGVKAGRSRAIGFCVDVAHARSLTAAFQARGYAAEYVVGSTPEAERTRLYRGLRAGTVNVLNSVMVLSEGFDEPRADTALMCRPTQSQPLYQQMAGRVLRAHPLKPTALILDFVDLTSRHTLQSVASLAGDEERAFVGAQRDGEPLDLFRRVGEMQARKARVAQRDQVLGDLLSGSPFVWHPLTGGRCVAAVAPGEWLTVMEEGEEGYVPVRVWRRWTAASGEDSGMERLFGRAVSLETAVNIAESQIPKSQLTQREARWRESEPTPKQLELAARLRVSVPEGGSRGDLSDLIDLAQFRRAARAVGLKEGGSQ